MKGPIQRLVRDRVERRDDARLPTAWFGSDASPPPAPELGAVHLFRDHGGVTSLDRSAPVLILLAGDHPGALAELVTHGEARERVYVLAPAGWGTGRLEAAILSYPTVLIRRVPEVPVSGVLRASGARIWAGATYGGTAPWCLRLDSGQADALRQIFLRLFWHDAVDEGWTGGKQLAFRPPAERPFDVPPLSNAAPVRLVAAEMQLDASRGGFVHITAGAPPTVTPHRLWIPASGDHHEALARLRRGGTEVAWTNRDLPELAVGPGAGAALLPGSRVRLRVELNAAQIGEVERLLSQPPAWRFGVDVRLGDHSEAGVLFRLHGASAAAALEREQNIEVGNVQAEQLRAAPQTAPVTVPAPHPLALVVRYRWTVIPPRLPTGASEDPLVGRWRKLDGDWSARIGKAREALEGAEQHRGRLRSAFSRLLSAMLGFERTHGALHKQLDALAARTPSVDGPRGAPGLLGQLSALEEQVLRLQGDLEETERKAREEQEREKQEGEWKARVKKAKQELATRREALAAREGQMPGLTAELTTVEQGLKDTKEDIPKDANKTGTNLKKDLQARQRRISDDLAKLDKDLKRLRAEIDGLEGQAAEQFTFKPLANPTARPAQAAGRFVPAAGLAKSVTPTPDEALPEVGDLRHHRGQRYLVIDSWGALEAGESASRRLKASLVAPEDT